MGLRGLLILACCLLCTGCAALKKENQVVVKFFAEHVVPENETTRNYCLPVLAPVGLIAYTLDAVLVIPVMQLDDAALDTRDALWRHFDWDEEYVTSCATILPRAVLTPIVFFGDHLGRCLFPIGPRHREGEPEDANAGPAGP